MKRMAFSNKGRATLAAMAGVLGVMGSVAPPASARVLPTAPVAWDDVADVYKKLAAERSSAIVTIKYVLKDGDDEQEEEIQGAVIEESGLILTSNTLMGGMPEAYKRMAGGRNTTPKDIKILIDEDNEGIEATLIARDSELDLAWLQVTKMEGKKLKFVDITTSGTAELGDRVMTLERLAKFNDRAPIINETRVRSVVSKPRKLVIPGQDLANSFGMPVFNDKGEFVGVSVLQLPSVEEMEADRGGRFSQFRSFRGGMILPGEDVLKATNDAKEKARSGKPVDEEPKPEEKEPEVPQPITDSTDEFGATPPAPASPATPK